MSDKIKVQDMQSLPVAPHRGEYFDRQRTLPKRVVKLALALASLKPGEHVFVVRVEEGRDLAWKQAALPGG